MHPQFVLIKIILSIMQYLKELLETSSIPSIQLILKSKHNLVKISGLTFFIILTALNFYYISQSIISYLNYDIFTNIDVIREEKSQFPAISLCINIESNLTSIKEILFYCQFDLIECTHLDFQLFTDYLIKETCFRFNSGEIELKSMFRNDLISGLTLLLNLKKYRIRYGYFSPYKLSLHINNASDLFRHTRVYVFESGVPISSGYNIIKIEREFVQRLSKPYNDCIKQNNLDYISDLYQYFIRNNKTYLQKDCFEFCVEQEMIESCNCSVKLGNIVKCFDDFNKSKCITDIYYKYIQNKTKISSNCLTKCPIECDSINFIIQKSYVGSLPKEYFNFYNISAVLMNDLVLMDIYYPYLDYTLISQIPKMEPFDLASNIGGTLGLFIGLCFMSFIEFIEILLEFSLHLIYLRKNNQIANK